MRLGRLDLNLLVALDALLTEQSVSLAADRICLSQSATSSALGRLRQYFDDDLLVMKGRQMVLTTRGQQLVEPVRSVLDQIRTTIAVSPEFDPAVSDRTVSIMTSDYSTEVLLSEAFKQFKVTAPSMKFEIIQPGDDIQERFERGVADILITVDDFISDLHPNALLFEDDFVVVGWDQNPHLNEEFDIDSYLNLEHVVTKFGTQRKPSFEDWCLRQNEIQRRVAVSVPNFMLAPFMLAGTERIATVHRRLARRLAKQLPLKIVDLPVEMPIVRIVAQWHRSTENDPCINWLISELKEIGATKERPRKARYLQDEEGPSSLLKAAE